MGKNFLAKIVSFLAVAGLVAPINLALAKGNANAGLKLPEAANYTDVVDLGQARDPKTGELVEGRAIIHRQDSQAKAKPGGGTTTKCYGYLASGAKWKTIEPWVVNPTNLSGLNGAFVFDNLALDITKWEDGTDGVIGNGVGVNILGDGSSTLDMLAADTAAPDGINEVYFGAVDSPGAIAVTIVWGVFSGPTFQRQLVEWDQVYDDVDYPWSGSGETNKMDFENIATHELGHSVGMADLYNSTCATETMYGYASFGETQKRDLNTGDIKGINGLY